MMTAWKFWTTEIARRLSDQLETTVEPTELVVPPDAKLGDFAFGCFKLAKAQKKNPAELAKEIASNFDTSQTDISEVTAAGPYVNFRLSIGNVVHRVIRDVEVAGESYGSSTIGKKQKLLLEYVQPNTHKEIHVGHLRNAAIGLSLVHILDKAGWSVIPVSYHGDVGAHVAKCLWHLVKRFDFDVSKFSEKDAAALIKKIPTDEQTGKFLGQMYAEASRALESTSEATIFGSDASKEKLYKKIQDQMEQTKAEISLVQQKLEAHDKGFDVLWRETRRWSLNDMQRDLSDLGIKLERQYLESEVVERGQEIVDDLMARGVAKESQGALVVDLEDVKLGVFLVRKSDGTSLYATKDLALAELKRKEYPDVARSIILVDNRQAFYFKQLFETLRRLGFSPVPEHVGYEFVTLKTGAMSSREGNVVTYQDFRDEVVAYARKEIEKRHEDWPEGKIMHAAWTIAMAGIKFGMLKQDSDKVFTFDMEQALSFEGATGPYCQYAATRLGSILRKANVEGPFAAPHSEEDLSRAFDHETEKALALKLAAFPSIVETAAAELRPSVMAQWCMETAQRINDFYRDVPVIESKGDLLRGRLRFASAARQALVEGLSLLGIPMPDEM